LTRFSTDQNAKNESSSPPSPTNQLNITLLGAPMSRPTGKTVYVAGREGPGMMHVPTNTPLSLTITGYTIEAVDESWG
jgi:hypothetical protein